MSRLGRDGEGWPVQRTARTTVLGWPEQSLAFPAELAGMEGKTIPWCLSVHVCHLFSCMVGRL